MTTTNMERILIEAMDLLEAGQPIEAILDQYPREAEELRAYLNTAAQLAAYTPQPLEIARRDSRAALLAAAAGEDSRATGNSVWVILFGRLLRPVMAVFLLAVIGFGVLGVASTQALPGDALYATKQVVEQAQLRLLMDRERQAQLREQQRQERVAEVMTLLALGRSAAVTFEGELESMVGERWSVDGVPVQVPSGAVVDGVPAIGRRIEVSGVVRGDRVVANPIIVLNGLPDPTEPELLPGPMPSPAPEPSQTPTPSQTPEPSAAAPILVDPTSSPTTPPTTQPVPSATATATVDDDNGNANDDDGGNSNDDSGNANGDDNSNDDSGNANDDNGGNANDDDSGNANDDDSGNANDDDNDNDDNSGNDNDDNDNGNDNDNDGGNDNDEDEDDDDGN